MKAPRVRTECLPLLAFSGFPPPKEQENWKVSNFLLDFPTAFTFPRHSIGRFAGVVELRIVGARFGPPFLAWISIQNREAFVL